MKVTFLKNFVYPVYCGYPKKDCVMQNASKNFFWISAGLALLLWSACYVHRHFVMMDSVTSFQKTAVDYLFK